MAAEVATRVRTTRRGGRRDGSCTLTMLALWHADRRIFSRRTVYRRTSRATSILTARTETASQVTEYRETARSSTHVRIWSGPEVRRRLDLRGEGLVGAEGQNRTATLRGPAFSDHYDGESAAGSRRSKRRRSRAAAASWPPRPWPTSMARALAREQSAREIAAHPPVRPPRSPCSRCRCAPSLAAAVRDAPRSRGATGVSVAPPSPPRRVRTEAIPSALMRCRIALIR